MRSDRHLVVSLSFGTPLDNQMSIDASESEPNLTGDDDSTALPPSGTIALSESDPEFMPMLVRAAERVRLMWNPPLCPEPSRLDDWFLGVARTGS